MDSAGDTVSPYESDRDAPTDSNVAKKVASSDKLSNVAASTDENKFQGAISAWRSTICPKSTGHIGTNGDSADVDLGKLVPELDSKATDIVTNQRDALLSRKDLAQKTKDFRKLDDPAKLQDWKGLLKGRIRTWTHMGNLADF